MIRSGNNERTVTITTMRRDANGRRVMRESVVTNAHENRGHAHAAVIAGEAWPIHLRGAKEAIPFNTSLREIEAAAGAAYDEHLFRALSPP